MTRKEKELVSMGKCSEMDIILDLWMHTIYNDEQVQGSAVGPVVYFRNCTGNPFRSVIKKVAKILAAQGIPCCECPKTQYKLYPLSDWNESIIQYSLQLACGNGDTRYQFEITFHPADSRT